MQLPTVSRLAFFVASVCALLSSGVTPARADSSASVNIDGRHIHMQPPAILREGSVFVPVRGVFENLGASVVFHNGRITAHGSGGETIVMDIGQRSATVNGKLVMLDTPPFIIGASTFVPLRFVSEALGATVSFDNRTKTVFIQSGQNGAPPPQPNPPAPPYERLTLTNQQPAPGSRVRTATPLIAATFSHRVKPASVRLGIDGRDITRGAFVGNDQFSVTPQYDLSRGRHTVLVSGTSYAGRPFSANWSFDVQAYAGVTPPSRNYIQLRSPGAGSTVSVSSFDVGGRTLPLSTVTVQVATGSSFPGNPGLTGPPGFSRQTRADPLGNFNVNVSLPNSSGYVRVYVRSVAPDGSSAEMTSTFASQ